MAERVRAFGKNKTLTPTLSRLAGEGVGTSPAWREREWITSPTFGWERSTVGRVRGIQSVIVEVPTRVSSAMPASS